MLTGVLITALIQSSSATTVMVVEFRECRTLDIDPIHRSHYGCQHRNHGNGMAYLRPWFPRSISPRSPFPLLAFALPLFFSGKSSRKSIGEFVFGFTRSCFMGPSKFKGKRPGPRSESGNAGFRAELYGYGIFLHHLVLIYRSDLNHDRTSLRCHDGYYIDYVCQRLDRLPFGSRFGIWREYRNYDYGQLSRINRKHTSTTSRVSAPCFQRFRCHVGFGALLPLSRMPSHGLLPM